MENNEYYDMDSILADYTVRIDDSLYHFCLTNTASAFIPIQQKIPCIFQHTISSQVNLTGDETTVREPTRRLEYKTSEAHIYFYRCPRAAASRSPFGWQKLW